MTHYIYFLIRGGSVVYIGATKDWFRRIREHVSDGKKFDKFRAIACSDYDSAIYYEKRWIAKFRPIDNRNGFGGPSSNRTRMTFHINRKIMNALRKRAKSDGKTISILIENALEFHYGI